MVEMAQLPVAFAQIQSAPVLQTERHPPVAHRRDLGDAAVDKPQTRIVARPADPVPGAKLKRFRAVHLGAALASARSATASIPRPTRPGLRVARFSSCDRRP